MSPEILGVLAIIVAIVAALVFGLVVPALCLALAAKIVSLPNRSFPKALGCTALFALVSLFLVVLFNLLFGGVGSIVSFVVGLFASAGIISGLYRSSYGAGLGTALLCTVFSTIISCIVLVPVSILGVSLLGQSVQQQFQSVASQIQQSGSSNGR